MDVCVCVQTFHVNCPICGSLRGWKHPDRPSNVLHFSARIGSISDCHRWSGSQGTCAWLLGTINMSSLLLFFPFFESLNLPKHVAVWHWSCWLLRSVCVYTKQRFGVEQTWWYFDGCLEADRSWPSQSSRCCWCFHRMSGSKKTKNWLKIEGVKLRSVFLVVFFVFEYYDILYVYWGSFRINYWLAGETRGSCKHYVKKGARFAATATTTATTTTAATTTTTTATITTTTPTTTTSHLF